MTGIATLTDIQVPPLYGPRWRTEVYKIEPDFTYDLGGDPGSPITYGYVIASFADDEEGLQTALFPAYGDGNPDFNDMDLFVDADVVGSHDAATALAKIGYEVVGE